MDSLERFSFTAALASLGLSVILSLVTLVRRIRKSGGNAISYQASDYPSTIAEIAGLIFLTISILSRWVITGHGPFSNMYEFAVGFAWGAASMGLFFQWRHRAAIIRAIGTLAASALLIFASMLPSKPVPLVPALQQSFLLSVHVASAILAYGSFSIGFGVAVLFLIQRESKFHWLPDAAFLDNVSYRSVVIGFPLLTLTIVLGAIWANIAWGAYWSWDPKETASLVTWLLYAGYLHARVLAGWREKRAAVLLIIGFVSVLFTFLGNYVFSGLHSYR
jgi:cytochrome c-type biogenesis protein CcsB